MKFLEVKALGALSPPHQHSKKTILMLKESKEEIIQICKTWLETFIIGLNLCPFARNPYRKGQVRFVVAGDGDPDKLMEAFLKEGELLLEKDPAEVETTLLIIPALGKMEHFMAYMKYCTDLIDYNKLTDVLMVVPFHPFMYHEGPPREAPNHFTGRSPYPIVHILRKASVDKLGAAYKGDVQMENNRKLRKMGTKQLKEMWKTMLTS